MYTVEARIITLRNAAESLGESAINIRAAVDAAHATVDYLHARGFQSPAATVFFDSYRGERSIMNTWPDELEEFAELLVISADAIEEAIRNENTLGGVDEGSGVNAPTHDGGSADQQGQNPLNPGGGPPPHSSSSGNSSGVPGGVPGNSGNAGNSGNSGMSGSFPTGGGTASGVAAGVGAAAGFASGLVGGSGSQEAEEEGPDTSNFISQEEMEAASEVPEAPGVDAYVNGANRPLLDQLEATNEQIESSEASILNMQEQRAAVQAELDSLTTRLGPNAPENARVRALQEQIASIDAELTATQANLVALQQQANTLTMRLERVAPAPGADLALIASLEGGTTSEAILRATRQADNSVNCVNYICTRMNIPPGIPNNAMYWVQNAMEHPEYGITVGNEPLPGSVIVMQPEHSYGHDVFGHVMYVERVDPDGTIWITDNNYPEMVRLQDLTSELNSPYIQYLYFPWETQA